MLVGDPASDYSGVNQGMAYVFFLSPNGTVKDLAYVVANVSSLSTAVMSASGAFTGGYSLHACFSRPILLAIVVRVRCNDPVVSVRWLGDFCTARAMCRMQSKECPSDMCPFTAISCPTLPDPHSADVDFVSEGRLESATVGVGLQVRSVATIESAPPFPSSRPSSPRYPRCTSVVDENPLVHVLQLELRNVVAEER